MVTRFSRVLLTRLLLITLLLPAAGHLVQAQELRLGVLAPRGELDAQSRWQPMVDYFKAETGLSISLVPLPPPQVMSAVQQAQVDLVLSHSSHTVQLEEQHGAATLATLNTMAGPYFGGVIIAHRDSGIKTVDDLRGKQVMSLKFRAAAGAYIFQTYHLLEKGIDPHKDFASLREGAKQDDLVLAVNNGLIDAAFVRTGLLESMQREGHIKLDDLVVVDRQEGGDFPQLRSTALYPEWCLSALPGVNSEASNKLRAAAMQLSAEHAAARHARIRGFVEPVSLDLIKQALRTLKIEPYNT